LCSGYKPIGKFLAGFVFYCLLWCWGFFAQLLFDVCVGGCFFGSVFEGCWLLIVGVVTSLSFWIVKTALRSTVWG